MPENIEINFYVKGGVYTDFNFDTLEPGTEENYGPFETYDAAYIKWLEVARFEVDNACHRVKIVSDCPVTQWALETVGQKP